jgi:hypothetical protein
MSVTAAIAGWALLAGVGVVVSQTESAHEVFAGLHVAGSGAVWALLVLVEARSGRSPRPHARGSLPPSRLGDVEVAG